MTTNSSFEINAAAIDDNAAIEARAKDVAEPERDTFRLALRYLYCTDGPTSISRNAKPQAEQYLSTVEHFVFQWLYKRTDGKLRRLYGAAALATVKRAQYRCEKCGFADVRALNIEKAETAEGSDQPAFLCLCANCNTVDARQREMAGQALERDRRAQAFAARMAPDLSDDATEQTEVADSDSTGSTE